MWAKVKRGLSAGRVQSVALRIIADREEEIDAFIPEEYWTLDAVFKVKGEKRPLTAKFYGTDQKKMTIHSKRRTGRDLKRSRKCHLSGDGCEKGRAYRKKLPVPFTTSTLQQEACKSTEFSVPRRPCGLHSSYMKVWM